MGPDVTIMNAHYRRWMLLSCLALLAFVAAVYPFISERAAHPLAVFVLPILLVAALGSPREAVVVGSLSVGVTLIMGGLSADLGSVPMIARVVTVALTAISAVVVANIRRNRELEILDADRTAELMETFQRVLVPRPSPPPGIVVGTRYVPGEERLMLGGDFVDALDLRDGSLGFIVGDVCGHGPDAAALGAAIRAGWKAIATYAIDDPTIWVDTLDEAFFGHGRHDTYATVCTGRLSVDGRVRLVSCGHPWPILLGEEAALVRPHVSRPLGVRKLDLHPVVTELTLLPGSALLVYTDGLIENRRLPDLANETALLDYLGRHSPMELDALLAAFGPDGFSDDVAVMRIAVDRSTLTAKRSSPDGASSVARAVAREGPVHPSSSAN